MVTFKLTSVEVDIKNERNTDTHDMHACTGTYKRFGLDHIQDKTFFVMKSILKRKSLTSSIKRSIPLHLITSQYSLELETASHSHHLDISTM